jgi:hypothetical protein
MNLVELIQDLVNNPSKLAEYKQDPATYLEREQIGLTPAQVVPLGREVTTVVSMGVFKTGQVRETGAGSVSEDGNELISLEGTTIQIVPLQASFLAESSSAIHTQLLPHSYISISATEKLFDLHLLFVSGKDDDPQVLYIKTVDQHPDPAYNFGNAQVILEIRGYILASKLSPMSTTLDSGSFFDPSTNTLVLNIDVPPQPPPSQSA